jgi:predicted  nucleic acid-binding Zn-ribbon protein
VIEGVCYGCFVSIATAKAGEDEPNKVLRTCETCGRFIYVLP